MGHPACTSIPSVLQWPPYMVSIQAPWDSSSLLAQDPRQPTRDSFQMEGTGPCPHGQPSEDMDARKAKEGSLKVVRYWCINTHVGHAPSALRPPKLKPWGWVPGVGTSTVWCFVCSFVLAFILFSFYFIFQTFPLAYEILGFNMASSYMCHHTYSAINRFPPPLPSLYHPSSWILSASIYLSCLLLTCGVVTSLFLLHVFFHPHGPYSTFVSYKHTWMYIHIYTFCYVFLLTCFFCLSLWGWLILLHIMVFSVIYFPAKLIIPFIFTDVYNSIVYMHQIFFIPWVHWWTSSLVPFPGYWE